MPVGGPKQQTYKAEIVITGTDSLTDTMQIINTSNFTGLVMIPTTNGLLEYNAINGEVTFLQRGYVDILAILNAHALQASVEFHALLEKYNGISWIQAALIKEVLVAIQPSQISIAGNIYVEKGHKIRFCSKKASGNIDFVTETIGGNVIPAGIITLVLHNKI
jgi:hypothetical protein